VSTESISDVKVSDVHLSGLIFGHDGRGFDVKFDLEAGLTLSSISSQLKVSNEGVVKVILAVIEAERRAA
jgi:hypothetical protein